MSGRIPRVRLAGALVALGLAPALLPAGPAAAGWSTPTARASTGVLGAARLAQAFTMVSGSGSGGATYTASKLLGMTTTGYVDLVNTGSVPASLSGSVTVNSFISTTVKIERCSAAWTGGTCPGTQASLMSTVMSTRTDVDWSSAAVAPGQAVRLQVTLGGSVANSITLTAVSRAARAPKDRTGG